MPPPSTPPRFNRPRDWAPGLLLLGALILAVALTVGWGPLLAPWRALSPWLLAGLFALTALSYGLRAARVSVYLRPRLDSRFPALLRLTIFHNTANNLLPMRTGELVFPWLMRRYFGQDLLDSAATLLWIRLFDLHCLGLLGIGILHLRDPASFWWLLALPWLALLPALVRFGHGRQQPDDAAASGSRALWRQLPRRLRGALPAGHGIMARVYLLTLLIWSLKFLAFALLLRHFLPLEFWRLLIGVMGAELSSVLPFHGVAGSGSYELAMVVALMPFGVDAEAALAGAVNLHLFLLGTTLLLWLLALPLPKGRERDVQE